jgi:hypothetical protein
MPAAPRPSPAEVRNDRVRAVVAEVLGALTTLALAVASLRHVIATARVSLLWYDGDSVLLPLVERSIRLGQPFDWAMSPALFFFPEIPVYLLCAAVTTTAQQALALNGVLVLVAVYVLLRVVAAQLMPAARRSQRIVVSVLAMAVVTALVLTESSATATSLELASLLLTSTYYYGVVLAMLATAALTIRIVRNASTSTVVGVGVVDVVADRGDPPRRIPGVGALVVLAVVAALTTMSNPLYVPWSAGPVLVTVWLLTVLRRVPWRASVALTAALGVGSTIGYLARVPLKPFVSLDPSTYIRPSQAGTTLQFFAALTDDRAATAAGDAELLLLFLGLVVGVGGLVWSWRVRTARTVLVACTLSVVTTVIVSVGVVVSGSETPRYLEPIVTIPLVALVAVAEMVRTAVPRTRVHRRWSAWRVVVTIACVAVLAMGVAVTPNTVRAVRTATYGPAACLDRWVGDRDVEGVGQFWTVRPLMAYGDDHVRLYQVHDDFQAYAWLVNLAPYTTASPTYVVVGSRDIWPTSIEDQLGAPANVVKCDGYDIDDYAGTPGATKLQQLVRQSGSALRFERGFGG